MTEEQLKEIEARARGESPASASLKVEALCALRGGDVIALVAEVRRLRESEGRLRAIERGKPPTQHEPTCELAIFLGPPRKASDG